MKKLLAVLFSLFIFIVLILILCNSSMFNNIKSYNSLVNNQTTINPKPSNISWLPEGNSCEYKAGLIGKKVLINYISNPDDSSVYVYDPQSGKKELIRKHGGYSGEFNGYTIITPFVLSDQKLLLHYNFIDNRVLQFELNDLNASRDDYSYSTIEDAIPLDNWLRKLAIESAEDHASKDKETMSEIEIYDLKSKREEKIFEYKSRYRTVGEGKHTPINSFQSIGYSSNSKFICWCLEEELGVFTFSVYNTLSNSIKNYNITNTRDDFDFVSNLSVSNTGDTIWFTGCPINNYLSPAPQTGNNIFKLDLTGNKISPELIVEDAVTYKTSFDNRYLVYEKLIANEEMMISLNCLNLDSMDEVTIDDNIMPNKSKSFDLSTYDNAVLYLRKDKEGTNLYLAKLNAPNSKPKLIYSLPQIKTLNSMYIGNNNKSILISYDMQEGQQRSTCIIDIN